MPAACGSPGRAAPPQQAAAGSRKLPLLYLLPLSDGGRAGFLPGRQQLISQRSSSQQARRIIIKSSDHNTLHTLQVSREAGHKLIHLLQQKALNSTAHVTSLEQARETAVPDEHPRVGSVWADLSVSPMVLGVVTQTDHNETGPFARGDPDRNACGCTQETEGVHGICVWLHPLQHPEGVGRLPHPSSPYPRTPPNRKMRAAAAAFPLSQLKTILCMDQSTLLASSPLYSALEPPSPGSATRNRPLPSQHLSAPSGGLTSNSINLPPSPSVPCLNSNGLRSSASTTWGFSLMTTPSS